MNRHELSIPHTHRDIIVRCGRRHEHVAARTIRSYIPDAYISIGRGGTLDMDQYIAGSPLSRYGMFRAGKMQRICQEFVDILASNYGDGQEAHLAFGDWLARNLIKDRRTGGMNSPVRFPLTLATFMVLADISREFGSRRISNVLHGFFSKHGERVIQSEHPRAVFLLGWSIMMSRMSESEQISCLREILRARPEVVLTSRYEDYATNIPEIKDFFVAIDRIAEREPGRDWKHRGRREIDDGFVFEEHRERRLSRSGNRPFIQSAYRNGRLIDPDGPVLRQGPPMLREQGVRGALDSMRDEQRELRRDVKNGFEDIKNQVSRLGRHGHLRGDWGDDVGVDYFDRWPLEFESEWATEWREGY